MSSKYESWWREYFPSHQIDDLLNALRVEHRSKEFDVTKVMNAGRRSLASWNAGITINDRQNLRGNAAHLNSLATLIRGHLRPGEIFRLQTRVDRDRLILSIDPQPIEPARGWAKEAEEMASKSVSPAEPEHSPIPTVLSLKESSWLDKCPVCKAGRLMPFTESRLFGLVTTEGLQCDNCSAIFTLQEYMGLGKDRLYQLSKVLDATNTVWKQYGHRLLTERDWKSIAYGGTSEQKKQDLEYWMTQLRQGAVRLVIADASIDAGSPILLKGNEETQLALPNIAFLEPRAVRTGQYGGPSFRITKGVYFRVGAFQAESHDEVRHIDQGTLTLTNRRLVFSGETRTINIDLAKIVSIEPYMEGIALGRSGKEKTMYFMGVNQAELTILIDDRTYREPFSGPVLMCLIERLVLPLPE